MSHSKRFVLVTLSVVCVLAYDAAGGKILEVQTTRMWNKINKLQINITYLFCGFKTFNNVLRLKI